jgi:hypothetical protein
MCGGGGVTTTSKKSKIPGFIEDAYKSATSAASNYADDWSGATGDEKNAYKGIRGNAKTAEQYMDEQQALINYLYGGGGMGEGTDAIRYAMGQSAPVYERYMGEGYLDPMSNPYMQPSIEAARSDAYRGVSDKFAKAGRSFSGAEAAAFGDAAAKSALPMLMGQYNQNTGTQLAATQGLLSGALGGAAGIDAGMGNKLKAQMAGPTQLANLNIPENMLLSIADRERAAAQAAAAMQMSVMSGLSGYPFQVTGTQKTSSDPFQTMVGGGLGLLGAFM